MPKATAASVNRRHTDQASSGDVFEGANDQFSTAASLETSPPPRASARILTSGVNFEVDHWTLGPSLRTMNAEIELNSFAFLLRATLRQNFDYDREWDPRMHSTAGFQCQHSNLAVEPSCLASISLSDDFHIIYFSPVASMDTSTLQRRRLIERAEGYLDLALALETEIPLEPSTKQGLSKRALRCLNQIQRPLGHKPYVLFLKGQACLTAGQHVDAVGYFEQATRIDPDNIQVYFSLGWSYKRCGRITDAIQAMKRAVELDAESASGHYNLACYFALDEHIESALLHLSFAFELDPKYREMAIVEPDFDLIRSDPRFSSMCTIVDSV